MVRIDDSESEVKCWLTYDRELNRVEEKAREQDWEQEIAVQLMCRVGCRASGVLSAKPQNLRWNSEGEYWELTIKGKNTKGGEKTVRDAYVPERVKENLDRYQSERGIQSDEPYVDVSVSTVRRWVREITDAIANESGSSRWKHVSSHDLRRSWANHHLVEEGVNVRVMMEIGGWSSYDAIEPYLGKPTASKIAQEMA
ncbi:site-specific integrase [Halobacterium salinarum]|uniref:site-specific integrase n=1 Tax=Halobacterium salinarum TaxID=2242 RepID=UPI002554084A|nr:site-specific integrase [Halobacterium salinarum]MDL0118257.1 site-specific integrase [Halobacterium salinarum]